MSTVTFKENWHETAGEIKQKFADLTDDDLLFKEIKEEELSGRLQKKSGKTKVEVRSLIEEIKKGGFKMFKIINSKMWLFAVIIAVSIIGCGSDDSEDSFGDTGAVCQGAGCVSIGSSGDPESAAGYVIMAKDGVSTVPTSTVTGNIALSPAARTYLTGWSLIDEPVDRYFTSAQVVAPFKLYAADNLGGTSALLTPAILSMEAAYTDAAGRPATSAATTDLGGGTLTSLTLAPGVYQWGTSVNIPTDLTLSGSATDVWIFKIAGTLNMASDKNVILTGGAKAQNIFWQVSDVVTIGAGTHFEGIILAQTQITMGNLSSIKGRLLAQAAINLDAATVTQP